MQKDTLLAKALAECAELKTQLAEAQRQSRTATAAHESIVVTLDNERRDWRLHLVRIGDEKELQLAAAERARLEALAARDAAIAARYVLLVH